jgi:hypothetical protein
MTSPYQYIDSAVYISGLEFDYIETYSMQRGDAYEAEYKVMYKEYERLKVRKERRRDFSGEEAAAFSKLSPLVAFTQYLINEKGAFHPSSCKTSTFRWDDSQVKQLKQILRTPVTEMPHFMCAPAYRDAIVFYKADGTIVSTLNICLGCKYMETKPFHHLSGTMKRMIY